MAFEDTNGSTGELIEVHKIECWDGKTYLINKTKCKDEGEYIVLLSTLVSAKKKKLNQLPAAKQEKIRGDMKKRGSLNGLILLWKLKVKLEEYKKIKKAADADIEG